MIPRGALDIEWSDLMIGLLRCWSQGDPNRTRSRIESLWSDRLDSLVCLSVRSGFDLALQILNFPRGSEILFSAITIPEMVDIAKKHGLIPVPIDIDPNTLEPNIQQMLKVLGPKTKAILVAHLFGSRSPLSEVVQLSQKQGLFLIEDCAQTYDGSDYRGHSQSDISMFSFGPIKTSTALGGALIRFKDKEVLGKARILQETYPRQSRFRFFQRICWFSMLKCLANPSFYRLFVKLTNFFGSSHEKVLTEAIRGFPGVDLLAQIRRQPSIPLLELLERRLKQDISPTISARIAFVNQVLSVLPIKTVPGEHCHYHSHWIFPIQTPHPKKLMHYLWNRGFDATQGASSLCIVPTPVQYPSQNPINATRMIKSILYLPMAPKLSTKAIQRLGDAVRSFFEKENRTPPHDSV